MSGTIAVTVEMDKDIGTLTATLSAWPDVLQYKLALNLEEFRVALHDQIQRLASMRKSTSATVKDLLQIDYRSATTEIARLKAEANGAAPGGMYANVVVDGPTQVESPGHLEIRVSLPDDKFPYARIVEQGGVVPPHDIYARNAKVLAFKGFGLPLNESESPGSLKSQLDVVPVATVAFAKFVLNHPGATFAGHFIIPQALESMQGELEDLILTSISQTLGGVRQEATPAASPEEPSRPGLVKGPRRI